MEAYEALLARRSIRRFTEDDVSEEHERLLIDAAFAAPSSMNVRPWHFVIVRDEERRTRLSRVHRWSQPVRRAPLVIAVLGRADAVAWVEDCAAATENVLTAATALGLGACWVGIHENGLSPHPDELACLEIIGATPDRWRALCLIAVGHPAARKTARTQYQPTKVSYEITGRHGRPAT